MSNEQQSGWRNFLWPIYGKENRLFFPMAMMIALIIFNYYMVRGVKDTLVITASGGSAITTFLKVWAVVPGALIFFAIFNWLSNVLPRRSVFYAVILPFLAFFGVFAWGLYPIADALHPVDAVAGWVSGMSDGPVRNYLMGFLQMVQYWSFSLFYVMAELWGSAVLSLLFWQFANDVIPVSYAKRFYAHFYLLGNVAVMVAGALTQGINKAYKADYEAGLQLMMLIVLVAGAAVVALYYYINRAVLTDPTLVEQGDAEAKPKKKKKPKMSLMESFRFLLSSRYLGLIAVLVISYGISINLIEVLWKELLRTEYPLKADYNAFMGAYFYLTGAFTIVAILIGSSILRKFGWTKTALATPLLVGSSGALFFACVIASGASDPATAAAGGVLITASVWVGLVQNLLSKPTKYAMFDPTKEMSYIPLDDESKMKGKAAVDVVGARLGKSGGALLQQGMVAFIGPVIVFAPYSAVITLVVVAVWTMAAKALGKRFTELSGEK